MPELPEVETIRQQLLSLLPFSIQEIFKSRHCPSLIYEKEFTPSSLKGLTILNIFRKGKFLIFALTREKYLLSHLGMSGSWRISSSKIIENHTHLQLRGMAGNTSQNANNQDLYLAYVDPRRFGRMHLVGEGKYQTLMQKLGVDIASREFTGHHIYQMIHRYPNRPLKMTLLDQKLFPGAGNYLANEICARSGILPTRPCKTITDLDCLRIQKATSMILRQILKSQGNTFQGGYVDAFGEKGEGVKNLMVFYQKICQGCRKNQVQKIILAGRGTYFCPACQQ